ncbi:RelA/SpoT domain-containing protein [Vibrio hangzhouensis]|uniref:RelA/SpoT domain-containing protein n=1 Tax=Vibrio hangzhouensis TaxID=462991 RepID=UPI001C95241D|nr:RelA/SpoT domain-containing protein [Vibrio hangzhouensis]MBY6197367.1 RelA/SpoT domain-containing protein [Vibrio hangzhouensis]
MYSSNQLKKLGKRLRKGSRTEEDLSMLANYKASFDEVLFDLNSKIFKSLSINDIPVILSGRSKRSKSLIRKLCRPSNHSMDLSRVDDIVGLRLIVRDIQLQDQALSIIKQFEGVRKITDYRESGKNYRAIHVVISKNEKLIELQIRTCAQHLWAEESESFGEKTKEGNGPDYIAKYLSELSLACKKIDDGKSVSFFKHELFKSRKPIEVLYRYLLQAYEHASAASLKSSMDYSFLVTYDTKASSLINKEKFWDDERFESVKEYKRICKLLDENRYDVLLFNSKLDDALYVTHSRYFPKGIFR